jgi:molecular chaperone Hsp33
VSGSDRLLKFLVQNAPVRGGLVRLDSVWRQMLANHAYPEPVARLLGEMTAAATLLATNIKLDGTLIMQIQGDGPVKLLVVECTADLGLRATAKLREDVAIDDVAGLADLVNRHGQGRCAILLDPRNRQPGQQPYQGVVPLEGDSIADALQAYMRQSEQLDTRLWLAADAHCAAGALLQRLPDNGGRAETTDEDAWSRCTQLAATLTAPELLATDSDALLRRLFWQERLDLYPPLQARFQCSCSRARIGAMLLSLGQEEVDSIVAERGEVEVTCDFCGARYRFDAVDVDRLFLTGDSTDATDAARH